MADARAMPDAVPALAATALFARGPTHIRGVGALRYKESNRIEALARELGRLGARVDTSADAMIVYPTSATCAGRMFTEGDHRIAMALAIAGLRLRGCAVENPECVSKSYPEFWAHFAAFEGM